MPNMPDMPAATAVSPTGPAATPAAGNCGRITNFAFAPATLTVPAGSTVTWTNHDEEPHTVVANDGSFHSPGMDTEATLHLHFTEGGDVRLHLLDPPVHARHRGGDDMTDDLDHKGMTRRQLMRHSAWFGAAVVLTVAGGEVISHVAGAARRRAQRSGRPALRPDQRQPHRVHRPANPNVAGAFTQAIDQDQQPRLRARTSSSTPATSPTWPPRSSSIRSSR